MPEKTKDGVELIQSRPVFHLGRWISAIIVGLLALGLAYILVTNPKFRWDVVWEWLFSKMIITGLMMTIVLTVLSMALGTVLAITMAIMRQSINPVLRGVASAYIWFFRGTPIYTQLIFWSLHFLRDARMVHTILDGIYRARPQRRRLPCRNYPRRTALGG